MTPKQKRNLQQRLVFAEFIKLYPFTVDNLDGEEWRDISDYEGYQVSNYGRVKSLRRKAPHILTPSLSVSMYLVVLMYKNGVQKASYVHRLVAKAFIPNPDNKPQVNHIDSCKLNACVSNLEWATNSENIRHADIMGLRNLPQGESHPRAKLTAEQVYFIRQHSDIYTVNQFREMFNVGRNTIRDVQLGKSYKSVGGVISSEKKSSRRIPDKIRAQIRADYKKGVYGHGSCVLAKKYGVNPLTILNIANEK